MRTRVKICGITRIDDALAAVAAGADALGFVFYGPSPRNISLPQASAIFASLPPFVSKVALFVNPSREQVEEALSVLSIDVLQFHGDEDAVFCQSFNKPYLKAIRVQQDTNFAQLAEDYKLASGLLFDAFDSQQYGGTGHTFDWSLLPKQCPSPLILAGGLTVQNVCQAITETRPYAVDISSGVEQSKGLKDPQLIKQFIQEVTRGNDQ